MHLLRMIDSNIYNTNKLLFGWQKKSKICFGNSKGKNYFKHNLLGNI